MEDERAQIFTDLVVIHKRWEELISDSREALQADG